MPNQLGIDHFDLEDALSDQKEYMCSSDLKEFIEKNHLNLSMDGSLNPRDAFGAMMTQTMYTIRRERGIWSAA